MTKLDYISLIPFLIISGAPIILMLTIVITRNYKLVFGISLLSFMLAFASLFYVMPVAPHAIEPLFVVDSYSILFLGILFFAATLITILSYIYIINHEGEREEYFIILFVATLGASILVISTHFVSFFLGMETLSISLYILIAYVKTRDYSLEAGVKYLVMATVASAFLLFGMALIYAATGTMSFALITKASVLSSEFSPILLAGFGMLIVGLGFKLALAPFHTWTPDIYQGAPAPVSAFIATISKGAALAIILRFFINIKGFQSEALFVIISLIAVISMFIGNLLALQQNNLKRLLAYSSIAHLGYLMITLLTGSISGTEAAIFYIVAYIITTLGAFGVISLLSVFEGDADNIKDYKGLFWKNPFTAIVFTLVLLSLAGIPLTAGFIAKFYLAFAGVQSGLWILVVALVINSVISLYYYLRIITTMFSTSDDKKIPAISFLANIVLAIIGIGILLLGILPSMLIEIIKEFAKI